MFSANKSTLNIFHDISGMVKKVLDATDDLCNYFDQRLIKNNLYHESKKMFQIWEATE